MDIEPELITRYYFSVDALKLPYPLSYYINLFQGHLQSRNYIAQIEEVEDGALLFVKNIQEWFDRMRKVFGIFKFLHETPDWVKQGVFEIAIKQEVIRNTLPKGDLELIFNLVNTIFNIYGVQGFFQENLEKKSVLYFRTRADFFNFVDQVIDQMEGGRFMYDYP